MSYLRVGLIGTGEQQHKHLVPSLKMLPGIKLHSVCSKQLENAKTFSERWSIPNYTDSWQSMVDPENLDAIVACVHGNLHYEVAKACMLNNIPVFVEKPPATSMNQLAELIDLEKLNPNATNFVGYNFSFSESYFKLLSGISDNNNKIMLAKIRFLSSGALDKYCIYNDNIHCLLYEFAIHPVNLVLNIMGKAQNITTKFCRLRSDKIGINISMNHDNGRISNIDLGTYSNRLDYRSEFVTENGTIGILENLNHLEITFPQEEINGFTSHFNGKHYIKYDWPCRRGGFTRTGYQSALENFFQSARTKETTLSPFSKSYETLKVLDDIYTQLSR